MFLLLAFFLLNNKDNNHTFFCGLNPMFGFIANSDIMMMVMMILDFHSKHKIRQHSPNHNQNIVHSESIHYTNYDCEANISVSDRMFQFC